MKLGVVALVFRCRPIAGTAAQTEESAEVARLTPSQVAEQMTEAFAIRVHDALSGPWPHVRAHDGIRLVAADEGA
jgi:8-oxo-dGTP diphosphatase